MKSFLEHKALKYLEELSELLESTDNGDVEYQYIAEEIESIETALINPQIDIKDALKEQGMSYGIRGKAISYTKSPRLTRVYFDKPDETQARGYGMKQDGDEWYMNVWGDNVTIPNLHEYLNGKGIPFKVSRYNAYGGRRK